MSTSLPSERPAVTTRLKSRLAGLRPEDRVDAYTLAPRCLLPTRSFCGVELIAPPALSLGRFANRRRHKEPVWISILAEGCRLASALPAELRLSLPVETGDAFPDDLLVQIADTLSAHRLPAYRLDLEFTEASLTTDSDSLFYSLAALRDAGAGLVLGGFGTGVTSLSLLRDRSFSGLITDVKLDRHLFAHDDSSQIEADRSIARAVVSLGRDFGLKTRADGIDTEETLAFLTEIGCQSGRGAVLGEPQAISTFLDRFPS